MFERSNASMWAHNEDNRLEPGEAVSITLHPTDEDDLPIRGDVTIGGVTVAEDVEVSGQTTRLQVPAPRLADYAGVEEVRVAGHRIPTRGSYDVVAPNEDGAETEPRSLSQLGFAAGSNAADYTGGTVPEADGVGEGGPSAEPTETTSETDPSDPIDAEEYAGIVNADNEQGYRLAPSFRDVYDSAQSLLSDAQDGTLDRLNSSDESSSSPSPSPSPSTGSGSTTTSGGGPSRRQLVVGAVVAVAAGAAALLGGN